MLAQLVALVLFVIIVYVLYRHFSSEGFASKEEKAQFLIDRGSGARDYSDFRQRTDGGYSTDFYNMRNLANRGQLSVDSLSKLV